MEAGLSFEQLFTAEYPRLVALGLATTGDRELARDLAQETMIRAHAHWGELRAYDVPAAWLRRVMSNLLVDHHRTTTSRRAAAIRLAPTPTETSAPAPSEWVELVADLTMQQRIVATLHYAEDRPVDEIAALLGISPGTVKSTLSKARERLRRRSMKEGRP